MRSPVVRFVALLVLVAAGLGIAYQLGLIDWLRHGSLNERVLSLRGQWWAPWALLGLFVVTGCLPLPATAVVLVAGAVYGPWRGWAFNWLGCLAGATAGYWLARALGRDLITKILGPERSAKLNSIIAQHGFWAMARARLMVPLAVASYGGGLSGMPPLPYLAASMVGMTLPLGLYTYVGHLLLTTAGTDPARMLGKVGLIVLAVVAMSLLQPALSWWRRRRA